MDPGPGISMNGQKGAVPNNVEPVIYDEDIPKERQGGKCCGCCCDYRRAVIIIDALLVLGSTITLVSTLLMTPKDSFEYRNVDDDAVLRELEKGQTPRAIVEGLGILLYAIPLFGALRYRVREVVFGILWAVSNFVATAFITYSTFAAADDLTQKGESLNSPFFDILLNGVGTGLFVYAHAKLTREIREGIMAEETYEREKYSCCGCV